MMLCLLAQSLPLRAATGARSPGFERCVSNRWSHSCWTEAAQCWCWSPSWALRSATEKWGRGTRVSAAVTALFRQCIKRSLLFLLVVPFQRTRLLHHYGSAQRSLHTVPSCRWGAWWGPLLGQHPFLPWPGRDHQTGSFEAPGGSKWERGTGTHYDFCGPELV